MKRSIIYERANGSRASIVLNQEQIARFTTIVEGKGGSVISDDAFAPEQLAELRQELYQHRQALKQLAQAAPILQQLINNRDSLVELVQYARAQGWID